MKVHFFGSIVNFVFSLLFYKNVLAQPAPACQPLHAFPESHEGEAQEEAQEASELGH